MKILIIPHKMTHGAFSNEKHHVLSLIIICNCFYYIIPKNEWKNICSL